jgi:hypothetical protein
LFAAVGIRGGVFERVWEVYTFAKALTCPFGIVRCFDQTLWDKNVINFSLNQFEIYSELLKLASSLETGFKIILYALFKSIKVSTYINTFWIKRIKVKDKPRDHLNIYFIKSGDETYLMQNSSLYFDTLIIWC